MDAVHRSDQLLKLVISTHQIHNELEHILNIYKTTSTPIFSKHLFQHPAPVA